MRTSMKGCVKSNLKRTTDSHTLQLHHLPNDIVRSILSRLTFRESLRMGLLSRKWVALWRSCCPKMVFTRATIFQLGGTSIRRTRTNFARRVNSLFQQLSSAPTLNKFIVKFGMRRKHACHVNRWVHFCAASRARHITLDFTPGVKRIAKGLADDKYIFPLHVFTDPESSPVHIKSLHLGYVCLDTTTGFTGFANLKKLTLHKVSFLGDIQHLLLPECTALEWLSISYCSFPNSTLTSCQPLCRLLYICLRYCSLEKFEIEAPNLTSFDLISRPIPFVLGQSMKVMEAKIKLLGNRSPFCDNLDYIYTELPAALPHVQKLSITSQLYNSDKLQGFAKTSARFVNLRHLTLCLPIFGDIWSVSGILRLAYLLELAPDLEELELHFHCDCLSINWALRGNMLPYRHDKLRMVLISGACNNEGPIELAYYILRSATRLECMIMDPEVRVEGRGLSGWIVDAGRMMAKKLLLIEEFHGILTIL